MAGQSDLDEWVCIIQVIGYSLLILLGVNFLVKVPIAIGVIIVLLVLKDMYT